MFFYNSLIFEYYFFKNCLGHVWELFGLCFESLGCVWDLLGNCSELLEKMTIFINIWVKLRTCLKT